jgi:hypothetical protein
MSPMKIQLPWLVVGVLLVGGIGFTVWDYKNWRYLETSNYGQGNPDEQGILPASSLALPYVSNHGRFRVKYPTGWNIRENPIYSQNVKSPPPVSASRVEIVSFEDVDKRARITIYLEKVNAGLTDLADQEAVDISRDRQYLSSANSNLTVLTWEKDEMFIQKALVVKDDTLAIIESTSPLSSWKSYVRTFESVYQSWVWF